MTMRDTLTGGRVEARMWLPRSKVEQGALDQLTNICSLPWVAQVAVMPDCHWGKGATVGSVIGMRGAVSPAAVGVDIGCGMFAIRTNLNADAVRRRAQAVFDGISKVVPVGFNSHVEPPSILALDLEQDVRDHMDGFSGLTEGVQGLLTKARQQMGTLGGGNHFIEVCTDDDDNVWLMGHSGSRNIGKTLADVHMSRAKALAHNADLPDRDLAVFLAGTEEMAAYRRDLYWAQRYALLNRRVMAYLCLTALCRTVMEGTWWSLESSMTVECHHNYVSEETHFGEELFVTRKGAISARAGEYGIIPGSMGTSSYIVRGLGNADSLTSASHGAGRRMSRGKAKKMYTRRDLEEQTDGVICRKDADVLDEIPGAYKDIDTVMANQTDLVEVVTRLKQFICIKG